MLSIPRRLVSSRPRTHLSNRYSARVFHGAQSLFDAAKATVTFSDDELHEKTLANLKTVAEVDAFMDACGTSMRLVKEGSMLALIRAATRRSLTLAIATEQDSGAADATVTFSDDKLNKKTLAKLKTVKEVDAFIDACSDKILLPSSTREERKRMTGLVVSATVKRTNLEKAPPRDPYSRRIAEVNFALKASKFQQTRDLGALWHRVEDLFSWHARGYEGKDYRDKYVAPYFPIIQSSGMGKTKLLFELRNKIVETDEDTDCKLVLCKWYPSKDSPPRGFDHLLVCRSTKGDYTDITSKLDEMAKASSKKRLVLLFDEAGKTLGDNGWCFRVVRWWLRLIDPSHMKEVVAIFTGTTTQLTNFYKEPPEESSNSRDADGEYYEKGNVLHDPFYDITTIGLFASDPSAQRGDTEFDRAVPYGRPLFALMAKQGVLHKKEATILRRFLRLPENLSHAPPTTEILDASVSALAHRLQLGQTTLGAAEKMIASSYACLVYFKREQNIAEITNYPDPVLSRLAMCFMMFDRYKGPELEELNKHRSPKLETYHWATKMREVFTQGLFRTDRGDVGEVACALYLLQCGDYLRLAQDSTLRTFSVPVGDFVDMMFTPNATKTPKPSTTRISFIQVCPYHLRHCQGDENAKTDIPILSDQNLLRQLYTASHGIYNCRNGKAYDILAAIHLKSLDKYLPFMVSVKSAQDISTTLVQDSVSKLLIQAEREDSVERKRENPENAEEKESNGGVCMTFAMGSADTKNIQRKLGMGLCAGSMNRSNVGIVDSDFKQELDNFSTEYGKRESRRTERNDKKNERDQKQKKLEKKKDELDELKKAKIKTATRKLVDELQESVDELQEAVETLEAEVTRFDQEIKELSSLLSAIAARAFSVQRNDLDKRLEAGEMVPLVFAVPDGDMFGISELDKGLNLIPVESEVVVSHPLARALPKDANIKGLLRSGTKKGSNEYKRLQTFLEDAEN